MKNENRYRNKRLYVCVTDEEKYVIKEKMKQLGMDNMGVYVRKMAMTGQCIINDFTPVYKEMRAMNYYINSISKNINQIAKRVNSTGSLYAEDLQEIRKSMDTILDLQLQFTKRFAKVKKIED